MREDQEHPGPDVSRERDAPNRAGPPRAEHRGGQGQRAAQRRQPRPRGHEPGYSGVEDPADWEAHRAATLASLAPVGHLEMVLADRVAVAAWRLSRITRYEVACMVAKQSHRPTTRRTD